MIRLSSAPTPEALSRLQACRDQAKQAEEEGQPPSDAVNGCYRHADVKRAILVETSEKCAYCESKITHVYWGDVEHVKPKIKFPDLRLDYDNLTLACAICNGKKGDYWNEEAPIVDPYSDNPEAHLVGLGPLVWHWNGSESGQRTIDLVELNRVRLRERRLECIQRLSALLDRYNREPTGPVRDALERQIRENIDASAEFALVARSFVCTTSNIQLDAT